MLHLAHCGSNGGLAVVLPCVKKACPRRTRPVMLRHVMSRNRPFLLLFSLFALVFLSQLASGQIAPAAVVITEGAPGEHFIFRG